MIKETKMELSNWVNVKERAEENEKKLEKTRFKSLGKGKWERKRKRNGEMKIRMENTKRQKENRKGK